MEAGNTQSHRGICGKEESELSYTCCMIRGNCTVSRYRILSKNLSLCPENFVTWSQIKIEINTIATGDKFLDYCDKTLERAAKPWSTLLGAFLTFTESWVTVREKFVYYQERIDELDRHTVVVYGDSNDVLGHLPREFSQETQREAVSCDEISECLSRLANY